MLKKLVFDKWIDKDIIDLKRKTESWIEMVVDPEEITLKIVLSWIKGKQKLTLGNMRFILKRIRENPDNPILVSIKKHINNLPSHKFLLSQNIQELLKIITKIDKNNKVNNENFCLSFFFKNADLTAITKSSLLVAIFFNIQIT